MKIHNQCGSCLAISYFYQYEKYLKFINEIKLLSRVTLISISGVKSPIHYHVESEKRLPHLQKAACLF